MKTSRIVSCIGLMLLFACTTNTNNYSDIKFDTAATSDAIKKTKIILYQMQLPTEMSKIFEGQQTAFTPQILNPVDNVSRYITSSQAAINIGVYGVNLSYCRLFGENQSTLLYVSAIRKLSEQLGIPKEEFINTFQGFEDNLSNKDSLSRYINSFFSAADKYLKTNESEVTASLIVLGGWVEAMHIAGSMMDELNAQQITERMAVQKYSLNTLIALLSNYSGDLTIAKYLLRLRVLKKYFDKVEIFYNVDDLTIDTLNKLIATNQLKIEIPRETIIEIKTIIESMRKEITE